MLEKVLQITDPVEQAHVRRLWRLMRNEENKLVKKPDAKSGQPGEQGELD